MEYLTVKEVAELLKVSDQTIKRFIWNKEFPAVKIGRQWRIQKKEFEEWLNNRSGEKDSHELP